MKGRVEYIDYQTAVDFLLPRHYSGRVPSISQAFGWYINGDLKAVCTFGKPASPAPCKGVCGEKWKDNVYELNRLCRTDDLDEPLSQFVSACLRRLRANNWIILSWSDMGMNHHGYIYQACNFIYTGCSKKRTDPWSDDGKHARHIKCGEEEYRVVRFPKHRYVYFCTHSKSIMKQWKEAFQWPILPYPKGDNNDDYELGTREEPIIIKKEHSK